MKRKLSEEYRNDTSADVGITEEDNQDSSTKKLRQGNYDFNSQDTLRLKEIETPDNETLETESHPKSTKKSRQNDLDLSSQEISKLKETEALFHSSLFRLQVSELLKEVTVKLKLKVIIEEAAHTLKDFLTNLPAGKEYQITDRKWLQTKAIKSPVVENPVQVKGTFQFLPPKDIRLSGSYVLETIIKPDVQIDLILQMPKECFQAKDYLNQRYTRKRALYLSAVASHLCVKKRIDDLKFSYFMGNPTKPVLLVTVKGKDSKDVKLCLHAVPELDTFKASRFHVTKNNIRPSWYFERKEGGIADKMVEDLSTLPATPFYNSSILQDLCALENDQFVEKMLQGSEGVLHGIVLLKVWLRQRGLLKESGTFSSYLMTAYVVYLILVKKINKLMSSYQVFKTTLVYLSKADWLLEPPSLYEGSHDKGLPTVDEFRTAGTCVFVDRTGYFNMAYLLTPLVFRRVTDEAKLSLEALGHHHQNCFDALFMTQVSFARKFDHIFHIALTPEVLKAASKQIESFSVKEMDLGGHTSVILSQHIALLLSKALDKRIHIVQHRIQESREWGISDEPCSHDDVKYLTYGLVLDASNAFSILDKGPLADSAEAREFHDFWGSKSEMRRFKDGRIHEAVLWTDSTHQSDRRLVSKKIVQHVLKMHCGVPKNCIHYTAGRLDPLLHLSISCKSSGVSYGTGEEQSLAIHHAFDSVNRAIRALSTIPLSIHSVQGIHPVFRHADVFPPLPAQKVTDAAIIVSDHVVPQEGRPVPQFVPALEVICTLEGSGKWPDDIEALQCMKILFHIKMGTELKEKHLLPVSIHKTHVDVLKDGYIFRLKLACSRELAVLRTVKTASGMVKFKDTEEAVALEKEIVLLPYLTHLLHSIQQEHPVYSASVRICKRWLASQMVYDLLHEEAVELMVAYIFISPHPYSSPGSPSVALMRFLHLISTFNWKADPLIVNLNKELTEDDLTNLPKEFTKNRATLPSMCIVTPQDKQGTKWTKPLPTEPLLQRLIILARESLRILESQVMTLFASADFKQIFRPPLEHYDHVIHILKKANVLYHQSVDAKGDFSARSLECKTEGQPIPVVEFNVVRKFFRDLQTTFGDMALFFHDSFGGSVIGMVWKQQVLEKKDFKFSNFSNRKPAIEKNEVISLEFQKEQILENIRIMGGGIVESIISPQKSSSD